MTKTLPQTGGPLFLTDGGLETTLIFHEGVELPHFAAFLLLRTPEGRRQLEAYYERYLDIAARDGTGFILESPTWRASPDWAERLGIPQRELEALNRASIELMQSLRDRCAANVAPIVVSGCLGPRGDGYDPGEVMTEAQAQAYHAGQVQSFAEAGADMVSAITMTNVPEAVGIARAAKAQGVRCVISFTLETDGKLPTGQGLGEAVEAVDAATGAWPAYYMINCAHPSHFEGTLTEGGAWLSRIGGVRANASKRSHQELNDSPDLDDGDPEELGREHAELLARHPQIRVFGGCCGTDDRHVACISRACRGLVAA
ncbi:homocysteine S-methyltransferase family protein [Phenylobacterium sp.]|jgi:S-methylmethionine-dependent homocysteine/selenocysteine methylase|uniref:homocysteine S-methyltransferase family protein n=1 Tax=Phenylobacterium sp. TaxID=1871053 RepID=UPI002E36A310|nr:homocysteine S-methyltransferase family protein [Phenylobacterium sp.]HEX2560946.1 homocysteine S-methyltransferase family protein [Phenylobacterium sp.]